MSEVQYLDDVIGPYVLAEDKSTHSRYPGLLRGQTADGYGAKITTPHMIKVAGEGRKRRVYATRMGNVASYWMVEGGRRLYLRNFDPGAGVLR